MEFHELQSIVESNTLMIQALGRRIAELAESIEQTNQSVEQTRQSIEQTNQNVNGLIQTISEFSIRSEARINALDSIVQRLDATNDTSTILRRLSSIESKVDHLLERGHRNGDQPRA